MLLIFKAKKNPLLKHFEKNFQNPELIWEDVYIYIYIYIYIYTLPRYVTIT